MSHTTIGWVMQADVNFDCFIKIDFNFVSFTNIQELGLSKVNWDGSVLTAKLKPQ